MALYEYLANNLYAQHANEVCRVLPGRLSALVCSRVGCFWLRVPGAESRTVSRGSGGHREKSQRKHFAT